MARWTPTSKIGKHEHIGRRLFDEPMLVGTKNQKSFEGLDLRNFEDTRDKQTSLDRLGRTGVDNRIVRYLQPLAEAASLKFIHPKSFNGWAVLSAHRLENPPKGKHTFPVVSSPITGTELDENIYHAHVVRPDSIDDYYTMALYLRALFTKYGNVHPIARESRLSLWFPGLGEWLLRQIKQLFV